MAAEEHDTTPSARRERLKRVLSEARGCTRCPELAATRKTVVFGAGNADADLMFVGEAPGASEDEQGVPFVGRAGKLLETLLGEIGLAREDVFIANVLKCLAYDARVQLGDGSWERIGRLVRARYDGEVMSVNPRGELVRRRVTGWHATPRGGRQLFSLRYRSCETAGAGGVGIQMTGDHRVLTERGYVAVEELQPGDRIATGQGISELAHDVVCGTVLGDGSLQASSALTFSHSRCHASYARFKASLIAELQPSVEEGTLAAIVNEERTHEVVLTRTRAQLPLRILGAEFYRARKLVPPWIAERLNPRMLAFWFMDDGYNRIRQQGSRPPAGFATAGYSQGDLMVLSRGLLRLGLPTTVSRGTLCFDVRATERLCELIAPYVPEEMRYKLNPDVRARVPFDPSAFSRGPTTVLFDEAEVERVTANDHPDTAFFCLDVPDTHNFVTAGGVVHNCRPPGNRDPQPIEIQNCRQYLLRQVELIEPTVICSLGNFSTKLLRGDPTGITRLHGQPQVLELGRRAVRLYPIFHPAAALYTPRMLETLRADFARLPEILSDGAPTQPTSTAEPAQAGGSLAPAAGLQRAEKDLPQDDQLGLF